jgi:serine/threonine-protein kinase RsbT
MAPESTVCIRSPADIVTARQTGRALASGAGFTASDLTVITTAISEIARNILDYARQGEITLQLVSHEAQRGLQVVARDDGPGIGDIPQAMQDGFTTSGGLGIGLPGTRRLMDEFAIESQVGKGTTVTMKKWLTPVSSGLDTGAAA